MLSIFFGDMPEAIYNPARYFKNTYTDDWIVDDLSTFAVLVTPQKFAKLKVKKDIVDITKPEKYFDAKICR